MKKQTKPTKMSDKEQIKELKKAIRGLLSAARVAFDTMEGHSCNDIHCTKDNLCSFCVDAKDADEKWGKAVRHATKAMRGMKGTKSKLNGPRKRGERH
jgi:hypothetical protein